MRTNNWPGTKIFPAPGGGDGKWQEGEGQNFTVNKGCLVMQVKSPR